MPESWYRPVAFPVSVFGVVLTLAVGAGIGLVSSVRRPCNGVRLATAFACSFLAAALAWLLWQAKAAA